MYSKNDYRYYLENQLIHSDDYLAHYGVKGMKWKQHKVDGERIGTNISIGAYETAIQGKTTMYNHKNGSSEYRQESTYNTKKNNFPKSTVSQPKKKKSVRQKVTSLRKKYGLYREKPKGKKLKGGGNVYVTHD